MRRLEAPWTLLAAIFQLTHSRGVRPAQFNGVRPALDFNSRTHVECDKKKKRQKYRLLYFNSRTHVECDPYCYFCSDTTCISTHALTWSATSHFFRFYHALHISTHALTWSATIGCSKSALVKYISTHALTWSATLFRLRSFTLFQISTHALTWSATPYSRTAHFAE